MRDLAKMICALFSYTQKQLKAETLSSRKIEGKDEYGKKEKIADFCAIGFSVEI